MPDTADAPATNILYVCHLYYMYVIATARFPTHGMPDRNIDSLRRRTGTRHRTTALLTPWEPHRQIRQPYRKKTGKADNCTFFYNFAKILMCNGIMP